MGDKFNQKCGKCQKEIELEWNNGVILPKGVCLIADVVFHDECFDKDWEEYEAKQEHKLVIDAVTGEDDEFSF